MNNIPPGSYLVEVTNPDLFYKPVRVDINSKGKIRARKVNYIQSSAVQQVTYPLKFKPQSPFKYFQTRETWRITDFLFNPMVLMMVLPLFLIMVLPKMMNAADAETQRVSIPCLLHMTSCSKIQTLNFDNLALMLHRKCKIYKCPSTMYRIFRR